MKNVKFLPFTIIPMNKSLKEEILKQMDSNYAILRDEDWEILCLLGRDPEGYYALYMEHYNLWKRDVNQILDRCAWVAFAPYIDEEVKKSYAEELDEIEAKAHIEEGVL